MSLKPNLFGLFTIGDLFLALLTGGLWLIVPVLRYMSTEYSIGEHLVVRRGLIGRSFMTVEYYRMKNISGTQGLLERVSGSGSIHIRTSDPAFPLIVLKAVPRFDEVMRLLRERAESGRRDAKVFIE